MTSTQPLPRGISALIPDAYAKATPGEKAAAQLAHLHTATVPVPVLAAAAALIAPQLEDPDPATREVAGTVHARLLAATRTPRPTSSRPTGRMSQHCPSPRTKHRHQGRGLGPP
ncbi:hypothetical protein ACFXPX_15390 [Kitasatospora sp. NPDC059146]|uniref:hypothetical protein n=1 Tax=Kitasatospora sp. NPDC059146 TaxID=3346741 RepID=UPI0036BA1B4B